MDRARLFVERFALNAATGGACEKTTAQQRFDNTSRNPSRALAQSEAQRRIATRIDLDDLLSDGDARAARR